MSRKLSVTYATYKDSGIPWLGYVPSHWDVAPLYAHYEVALGKMLDSKRVSGQHLAPYLRNVDVQWDSVNIEDLPQMDFGPGDRLRYRLEEGDLLVCEGGEVGRAAAWEGELDECYYQKAIHRVRPLREDQEPRFLFYVIRAAAELGVFVAGSNPNTIDHLTAVQLRHYRFPFPRHTEQRTIAAFLDRQTAKIDDLIEQKQRLIELLQEKRSALITQAVTKGLDPDVEMKDSGVAGLGQIPKHWEAVPLRQLLQKKPKNGLSPPINERGSVPTFSISAVRGGEVRITENLKYADVSPEETQPYRVEQGDILLLRGNGNIHYVGLAGAVTEAPPPGCIFPDILIRIRVKSTLTSWFLVEMLNSWAMRPQMEMASLTSAGIWKISGNRLADIRFPVPPRKEQLEIERELSAETRTFASLTDTIELQINLLHEYRTALISAAVTGKIDVRETSPSP